MSGIQFGVTKLLETGADKTQFTPKQRLQPSQAEQKALMKRAYSTGNVDQFFRSEPLKKPKQEKLANPPSWLDRMLNLPGNTRVNESLKRQVLFDRITEFEDPNPYRVNSKKTINAYVVLKDLLRSPQIQGMLNKPDEHGNYPLDYAATVNRPFIMKMLVDQGANRMKSWESWPVLKSASSPNAIVRIDNEAIKHKKATLYQNPRFQQFLTLAKKDPKLAEIRDENGDTLLHYLLQDHVAESHYGYDDRQMFDLKIKMQRQNADWQRTLRAILDTGLRLNLKNNAGESPLSMLEGLDRLFPQTIDALKCAGAKTQLLPRPGLMID